MRTAAAYGAEAYFQQSIEWSRRQGARAWELRAATDLAGLWMSQSKRDAARELLQPLLRTFEEGHDTADVKAAERLLEALS